MGPRRYVPLIICRGHTALVPSAKGTRVCLALGIGCNDSGCVFLFVRSRKETKAASINGHSLMPGKIKHDHLDSLLALLRLVKREIGVVPKLWKADIDSAFRRIPLCSEHAWAAGTSLVCDRIVLQVACLCV